MSNPYGWSQPSDGQPAVYFAPPGENVRISSPHAYGSAPETPYDNGYGAYRSFIDQYSYQPPHHDPFAPSPRESNPFLSLSARGARPKVTMTEAMILWLKNWNNFTGRASRSEYWWIRVVQLVGQVLWWVLAIGVLQMGDLSLTDDVAALVVTVVLLMSCLVMLVLVIPTLSLTVRRLHDTDHSGWYFLIQFLPFGSWLLFRALRQGPDPAGFRFDDSTSRPYGIEDID
jgi:uncharacterized membrane protein YhaH (DUF805 family)